MTAPFRDNSELMELLSAVWDSRLDKPTRARIEELLSREPRAGLELLISYSRLHLDLEWLVSSKAAQKKALESIRKIHAAQETSVPRYRDWRLGGLAGLAATIVISVLYVWYSTPAGIDGLVRSPQPVGKVVRLENASWMGGGRLQPGDALMEGQTVDLQRGFAQLSMGYGADVLLEGPCRARIVSDDRVALQQGKLGVRAAKWAVGFKVETEDLVATDLGTWFSVQSGAGKPPEIHVLEGAVVARPRNAFSENEAERRLRANQAMHMTRDGAFQAIRFRREAAADGLTQFQPLRPIQIWNTGIGLRAGDEDPHWTVTAGDEQTGPYPEPAIVGRPHFSWGINEPERSQWISVLRGTSKGVPARSRYTFETTFDLTGFDLGSVWIAGLILADDGVDEVRLNGKRLDIKAWTDWNYGASYVKFRPIEIRGGFVPGVNRVTFVVKNETFIIHSKKGFDFPDSPNPLALRAEWQAFGRSTRGQN
jgi:hypothetical protein